MRETRDDELPSKRAAFPLKDLVAVLFICGGLVALLVPAVRNARNAKGPPGDMIPTGSPRESNRITLATGLSIVAPVNWDQTRDMGPDSPFLQIAARGAPGRRLGSIITISLCDPIPDKQTLESCQQVQFQGAAAYEKAKVEREDTFDDPAQSSYDLYIARKGMWWRVHFSVATKMTELPNSVRQYIETIKFPDSLNLNKPDGAGA